MGSYISSNFVKNEEAEELSLEKASELLENTKNVEPDLVQISDIANVPSLSNTFSTLVGTITHETERNFIIDGKYSFDRTGYDFTIGSEVSFDYLTYDGKTTVSNIRPYQKGWDTTEVRDSLWSDRVVICKVEDRQNRELSCSPGEIKLSLDNISVEFLPIVGDWLEITVKSAVDENKINLSGKVLEVVTVLPVRPHVKTGKVTSWKIDELWGAINNVIYFNKESLSSGYVPVVGDSVVSQIIESQQQSFSWRAVSVIPEFKSRTCPVALGLKKVDFEESHSGIVIPDICLNFNKLDSSQKFKLKISNETEEDYTLLNIELPDAKAQCKILSDIKDVMIYRQSSLEVSFECVSRNIGHSRDLVLLIFEKFRIGKYINISVNITISRSQSQKPMLNKDNRTISQENDYTIRRRSKNRNRFVGVRIPPYKVPKNLLDCVKKEELKNIEMLIEALKILKPSLFSNLLYTNYEDKFHTLLHLEEIYDIIAMEAYNQENASFIRKGEYLTLAIDNLSERRPSIIVGDKVVANESTLVDDADQVSHEGIVDRVTKNEICIIFSPRFHDSCSEDVPYNVKIVASRTPYIRLHHAVYLAIRNLGQNILFPTRILQKDKQVIFSYKRKDAPVNKMLKVLDQISEYRNNKLAMNQSNVSQESGSELILKLEWYNKQLNEQQKNAVLNVLWGECRPLPYIIFGPPGTGKTVTLIEIILQLVRLLPHSRLLVAAPSNSAADLIALRLIDSGVLKPGDLVRLIGYNYAVSDNIPVKLVPFCATASTAKEHTVSGEYTMSGVKMECGLTVIGRHRITVATCSATGTMFNMGFPRGHFSHIIVDEAAQATEPDVLIPLSFLDTNMGQAVLAGDPMQLGPVIMSKVAAQYGLCESYLERLINRFPYVRDLTSFSDTCGYDPRLVTKLLYSYRALPSILNLYSSLFYNGELIATIDSEKSKEALLLSSVQDILPKLSNNQPPAMLFHGVVGENYQTPDSPSWCNPHEVAQVFFYVNELYRLGLKASNIGIITPYIKQVQDIRAIFVEAEFEIPKVGTVEDFQGQEFDVIILSTVRSKQEYISYDVKNCLGFLSNPKRLNVAISRAKSLFIIVGNPNLLCTDIYWRSVIKYCLEYGQYAGCEINI